MDGASENRRPVGVMLAAIVLGLGCLLLFAAAALTLLGAALMRHGSLPATPGYPSPPAGAMAGAAAAAAVFLLALSVWGGATFAGLLRMRGWARISILIIGGGVAAVAALNAVTAAAMPVLMRSVTPPPNADPALLHVAFVVIGIFWLVVAGIGIWWLVYFALRSTRMAFLAANAASASARPVLPPLHAAPPSTLADFAFAEPMPPSDILIPDAAPGNVPHSSPGWTAAITSNIPAPPPPGLKRPVSTTVIGAILILVAFVSVFESLVPFPLFFFGVVLQDWPAHLTMLAWAVLTGYAGFGLIQLKRPAWWLTVVLVSLGLINSLLTLLPAYRARMVAYSLTVSQGMSSGGLAVFRPSALSGGAALPPQMPTQMMDFFVLIGVLFGALFSIFLLVLLARARWAFEPQEGQPPIA